MTQGLAGLTRRRARMTLGAAGIDARGHLLHKGLSVGVLDGTGQHAHSRCRLGVGGARTTRRLELLRDGVDQRNELVIGRLVELHEHRSSNGAVVVVAARWAIVEQRVLLRLQPVDADGSRQGQAAHGDRHDHGFEHVHALGKESHEDCAQARSPPHLPNGRGTPLSPDGRDRGLSRGGSGKGRRRVERHITIATRA